MNILEQCRIWNENDEYQKIIDALEAILAEERTPEMDSELARAYNNIAEPSDRKLFQRAIALLKPHEEYFEDDHCWNFRIGYSYFYLDQEGRALPYFKKALEARPGDGDTEELIRCCEKGITLPRFAECFRERSKTAWDAFEKKEAELRRIMDEDKNHERGGELVGQCEDILNLAFDNICFEIGFNGEKYELILTPEGDKVRLYGLVYFQRHAPQKVLEHWNIIVGRQPNPDIGLGAGGWEVSGDDVQIWTEQTEEHSYALSVYCEKLLPLLKEEEGRAWWMLTTLTDQVLGEIPHMRYIDSFDVLEQPKEEPGILLSGLPELLREKGEELSLDPQAYLETYIGYQLQPDENPDADWRLDTIAGSTSCAPLLNGYLNGENEFADELEADGAVAGFFCYPLDGFGGESQKIFDFRDRLEEALTAGDGAEQVTLTGGATGIFSGYVDFIAWDLRAVLHTATAFFEKEDVAWANFHTFRREAGTVGIKIPEEASEDDAFIPESEASDGEEDGDSRGAFAGFALLSKEEWDKEQFIRDMKEKWDITVAEEDDGEKSDDTLVFEVGDMIAAVSLMPFPVPDGEAELNAENNYMWQDAVKAAKEHRAHIMTAVLGKEESLLERGKLYVKLLAACCRQKYVTGIYTSGVVFEPRFYEGFADMMRDGELPIYNWIWFGLYRSEGRMNAYTYGMEVFGKKEMEVLGAEAEPGELRDFLTGIAGYVLEGDVELQDGETIGFSADDIHTITCSEGAALPEQTTLKISYAPEGEED